VGRWTDADVDGANALVDYVHISPAYHDEHPAPEGPATSPHSALFFSIFSGPDGGGRRGSATDSGVGEMVDLGGAGGGAVAASVPSVGGREEGGRGGHVEEFGATASFIHPYCEPSGGGGGRGVVDEECGADKGREEERQSMSPFDFDLLPRRLSPHSGRSHRGSAAAAVPPVPPPPGVAERGRSKWSSLSSPRAMLSSAQYKCASALFYSSDTSQPSETRLSEKVAAAAAAASSSSSSSDDVLGKGKTNAEEELEGRVRTRFKLVRRVPLFGPLTKVLSPVVSRAQWEIVMRSCGCAILMGLVLVGCLLALPEKRRGHCLGKTC
jgi:hypothetical protein